MRVIVSKKQLASALKVVTPAVAKRATLPVLSGVFLDASLSGLALEATDLEIATRRSVDASVQETGSLVAPAKALAKAVAAMPGDELVLTSEGEDRPRLSVRSGSRTVTLEGFTAEDWPRMKEIVNPRVVATVPAQALADAFGRAAICASDDEARPVLTSVALFPEGSSMEVVATDSYRLGAVSILLESPGSTERSPLLIPSRAAEILAKQLRKRRGDVEIRSSEPSDDGGAFTVEFAFRGTRLTVRRIEGEFPNWRQLLPEPVGASCDIQTGELASALKAVAAVRQNGSPVRMSFGERCSVVLAERDLGEVSEQLAGARYNPDGVGALEVAFNPDYLADALRFCGGEQVRVWLRDGLKPALFGTPEIRYLLMPVRIS